MSQTENKKNLKEWQDEVAQLVKEKGWTTDLFEKYFLFQEEVGELTKAIRHHEMFHLEVEDQLENDPDPEITVAQNWEDLAEEIADVQLYLLDLANHFGLDLDECLRKKIALNRERQWH